MCQVPRHATSHKHQYRTTEADLQSKTSSMEEICNNNTNNLSLLEYAADDNIESFKHLVEQGAMIDGCEPWYCRPYGSKRMAVFDRTPAMIAAMYGSLDVLNYILQRGANVNIVCGTDGNTVLHSAASSGLPNASQMVDLLLRHGANPEVLNAQGLRPLDTMPDDKLSCHGSQSSHGVIAASEYDYSTTPDSSLPDDISDLLSDASPIGLEDPWVSQLCDDTSLQILATVSDIKNSAYATDEFRMYSLKVRPCSRAYSHDWTECPFAHPGENARRRDPRKYNYSCVPCSDFRRVSSCKYGDGCEYAHGVFETWLHPAQYRTRMCKDAGNCSRRICFFAHSEEQLRVPAAEQNEVLSPTMIFSVDAHSSLSPQQGSPVFSTPKCARGTLSASKSMNGMLAEATLPAFNGAPSSGWSPSLMAGDLMPQNGKLPFDQENNSAVFRYRLNSGCSPEDFCNAVSPKSPLQMYLRSCPSPLLTGNCSTFGDLTAAARTQVPLHPPYLESQMLAQLQAQEEQERGMVTQQPPYLTASEANHSYYYGPKGNQAFQQFRQPGWLPTSKRSQSSKNLERAGVAGSRDWGSPNGKPEWGVSGDDLNRFRKSISFKDKAFQ